MPVRTGTGVQVQRSELIVFGPAIEGVAVLRRGRVGVHEHLASLVGRPNPLESATAVRRGNGLTGRDQPRYKINGRRHAATIATPTDTCRLFRDR